MRKAKARWPQLGTFGMVAGTVGCFIVWDLFWELTFIRIGSVTLAFDQSGRLVPLAFSQVSGGGLSVTLPASRTTAPPGPYMLFLVNANGVPSIGQIMLLQ